MSLPVRECGLKLEKPLPETRNKNVTPRAGVWIETKAEITCFILLTVTPRAGVWIETVITLTMRQNERSLPVRECGLKHVRVCAALHHNGHSPCGSVD